MVSVKDGKAVLPDGTLAGSVTDLHTEVRNLVSFGIPFEQAVRAASLIPARAIGMEAELGSIEPGKAADFLITAGNPLESLRALRRPRMVVARGALIRNPVIKKNVEMEQTLDSLLGYSYEDLDVLLRKGTNG